jgi:(1->4)-alpha-D-glucan 1-alpha-D-glucosylmutase
MRLNKAARTVVDGEPAPDRNDEYRFYQILVGMWPAGEPPTADLIQRLQEYMVKAAREAKRHSSWINSNEAYENAIKTFIERVLHGPETIRFLAPFLAFHRRVARSGMVNSLSQVVLKIASPGVPDFYQGSEFWDLHLVDPDNRRPVDFALRKKTLETIDALLARPAAQRAAGIASLVQHWTDGGVKLLVTAAGLRLRSAHQELFLEGDYVPLEVASVVKGQIVAFARTSAGGRAVIAIAPHLAAGLVTEERPVPLGDMWRTSRIVLPKSLAGLTWRDAFTGTALKPVTSGDSAWLFVGQALKHLPVALLVAV